MDFLKQVGAAGIDLVGNVVGDMFGQASQKRQYDYNRSASAEAFSRNAEAYATRYQTTVDDMKKAGLNPILAASSGFGVGSSPQATALPTYIPSHNQLNFTSSAKQFQETEKAGEETKRIKVDKKLIEKKISETMENTKRIREQAGLYSTQEKIAQEEINNARKKFWLLEAQIANNLQQAYRNKYEGNLAIENEKKVKIAAELMQKQITKIEMELIKLGKISEVYQKPGAEMLAAINEVTKALNLRLSVGMHFGKALQKLWGKTEIFNRWIKK